MRAQIHPSLRPMRTDDGHNATLRELSAFFDNDSEPGTPEGDCFEMLLTLVESYERKHFPIDLPDPVEAIKFRIEQSGLTPEDLRPMIGRLNRVYEVLNRKRPLTLPMIWKLHQGLGLSEENLIRAPDQLANFRH